MGGLQGDKIRVEGARAEGQSAKTVRKWKAVCKISSWAVLVMEVASASWAREGSKSRNSVIIAVRLKLRPADQCARPVQSHTSPAYTCITRKTSGCFIVRTPAIFRGNFAYIPPLFILRISDFTTALNLCKSLKKDSKHHPRVQRTNHSQ